MSGQVMMYVDGSCKGNPGRRLAGSQRGACAVRPRKQAPEHSPHPRHRLRLVQLSPRHGDRRVTEEIMTSDEMWLLMFLVVVTLIAVVVALPQGW